MNASSHSPTNSYLCNKGAKGAITPAVQLTARVKEIILLHVARSTLAGCIWAA